MNQEMLTSIIRQLLFVVFGALGFDAAVSDPLSVQAIASGLAIIATSVWALWTRRDKALVASAAAKVPVSDTAQKSVGIEQPVKPK